MTRNGFEWCCICLDIECSRVYSVERFAAAAAAAKHMEREAREVLADAENDSPCGEWDLRVYDDEAVLYSDEDPINRWQILPLES